MKKSKRSRARYKIFTLFIKRGKKFVKHLVAGYKKSDTESRYRVKFMLADYMASAMEKGKDILVRDGDRDHAFLATKRSKKSAKKAMAKISLSVKTLRVGDKVTVMKGSHVTSGSGGSLMITVDTPGTIEILFYSTGEAQVRTVTLGSIIADQSDLIR